MIPMTRRRRAGHIVRPVSSSRSARSCRGIAQVRRIPERSGRLLLVVFMGQRRGRGYRSEFCPQAVSGSLICEIADNVFNLREIVFPI